MRFRASWTAGAVAVICMLLGAGGPTAPASAASGLSWSSPRLIDERPPFGHGRSLQGISCPSASLCVAVDRAGNVVSSNDPTGPREAWTVSKVDTSRDEGLTGISCPSVSLCVAVDGAGNVVTSTGRGWERGRQLHAPARRAFRLEDSTRPRAYPAWSR